MPGLEREVCIKLRKMSLQRLKWTHFTITWRVPNPPGANPLVAERAFPTSDYWGRTGVARCAEEMTGICRDFQ